MITKGETYIIGEIGQNHNGSVDVAKLIVELISRPVKEETFGIDLKPMNAVKMTKRDLNEELTNSQMNRIYDNPNSFGRTYGEHRAFLELDDAAHYEVYKYAKEKGLDFVETLCAKGCMSLLKLFTPDYLKVASRDLTNLPLLAAMAETKIPIILSTGMAGRQELDNALDTITRYHSNISILHCVSQYPTHPDNLNLKTISYLKKHYSQYPIGFSDHTIGISAPVVAVGMGAEIIEKRKHKQQYTRYCLCPVPFSCQQQPRLSFLRNRKRELHIQDKHPELYFLRGYIHILYIYILPYSFLLYLITRFNLRLMLASTT